MGGGVEQRAAERPRPRVMKHMSEQVWVFSLGRAVAAWRETQQGAEHSALHNQLSTPDPFSAMCSVVCPSAYGLGHYWYAYCCCETSVNLIFLFVALINKISARKCSCFDLLSGLQ